MTDTDCEDYPDRYFGLHVAEVAAMLVGDVGNDTPIGHAQPKDAEAPTGRAGSVDKCPGRAAAQPFGPPSDEVGAVNQTGAIGVQVGAVSELPDLSHVTTTVTQRRKAANRSTSKLLIVNSPRAQSRSTADERMRCTLTPWIHLQNRD